MAADPATGGPLVNRCAETGGAGGRCGHPARFWIRRASSLGARESGACGRHLAQAVEWASDGGRSGVHVRVGAGSTPGIG